MSNVAFPASTDGPGPIEVALVSHTHWDREWYEPFQVFRSRLVALLDALLPLLENDLSYARFLLDGQTAVVDDYLEIRPEAEATLRRLGASGRLQMGPWMILMDEYMVSGETLVRDLQFGIERAAAFGGAMPVGYLPDMFGHVAQMPQILARAGLDHAVVWRGVPNAVTQSAFWWDAPDGSRVRAEYLYGSYSNGRDLPDDAKQLVARASSYDEELGAGRLPGGGLLLMNGTDHQMPQPWLGRVVAEANEIQDDYRFVVTSLPEYLTRQPSNDLVTVTGELRSGARTNVLMGVASNHVDTHQRAARAERAVERLGEPLATLFLGADEYPHALLHEAWRLLILNSAHDSSCACSHDEVVEAVNVRYDEARQIAAYQAKAAVQALAQTVDAARDATVVVNPTPVTRGGVIEVKVTGSAPTGMTLADGRVAPVQILETTSGEAFDATIESPDSWVFEILRGPEFAGAWITHVERVELPNGNLELALHMGAPGDPTLDLTDLRAECLALASAGHTIRLGLHPMPSHRVAVGVPDVAGYGWTTLTPTDATPDATPDEHVPFVGVNDNGELTNTALRVAVDPDDGTLTITTDDGVVVRGANRYVDGGDGGDTYNYSPPADNHFVDTPTRVDVVITERGPVRVQARIDAVYSWPTHAIGDSRRCSARSDELVETTIHTTIELRAYERFVRVHTEFDNRSEDHRLRAHVPLPRPVAGSDAECAFAVVSRGLTTEGGPHELALPTWVSRRFVDASDGEEGVALLHDGLLEYEIVNGDAGGRDAGQELALTLLRATGYLSRTGLDYRPNPAGPIDPLRTPQLRGRHAVDYAILPHRGDWASAELPATADAFLIPFSIARGQAPSTPSRAAAGHEISVTGAYVSALARADGGRILRLVNLSSEPTRATIEDRTGPASGWIIDLVGRPLSEFNGGTDLAPWQIMTLRLREQ
jgi:mannosylglycerate hydrolase